MPRLVAGGDAAFSPDGSAVVAGWVVWDALAGTVVETAVELMPVTFPYVPGLLSFREAPALLAAARRLKSEPGAFLIDGQGLAHPRRLGIACHVGLWLGRPTIGCAKSRLCGQHAEPGARRGASTRLVHEGETIGRVVRTREGVKPLYVSVGHLVTLEDAVKLTLLCCRGYRLPEPARLAHQLVTRKRKQGFDPF
jgi:deoxyribonuclease V